MPNMSMRLETSHALMSVMNDEALRNIWFMLVTLETSHALITLLNEVLNFNI
jgi:hypothetical protein